MLPYRRRPHPGPGDVWGIPTILRLNHPAAGVQKKYTEEHYGLGYHRWQYKLKIIKMQNLLMKIL